MEKVTHYVESGMNKNIEHCLNHTHSCTFANIFYPFLYFAFTLLCTAVLCFVVFVGQTRIALRENVLYLWCGFM